MLVHIDSTASRVSCSTICELIVMLTKPLCDDLSFVTCCDILLEASSSAAVIHQLQGLTCCAFGDALLLVTNEYFSYCCLPVSSNECSRFLTSGISKAFPVNCCSLDSFWTIPWKTLEMVEWEIPPDQPFMKHSNQPVWPPNRAKFKVT